MDQPLVAVPTPDTTSTTTLTQPPASASRRAVPGRILHDRRLVASPAQGDDEIEGRLRAFAHRRIGDVERRRAVHRLCEPVLLRLPAVGVDCALRIARERRDNAMLTSPSP